MSDPQQEKRRKAASLAVAAVIVELKQPAPPVFRPREIEGHNWRLSARLRQMARRER